MYEVCTMEDVIIEQRTKSNRKFFNSSPKIKQKQGIVSYFANLFNKTLLLSLLFILDFVLFCRVGNVNIFDNAPWTFSVEIQYILIGIVFVVFILIFISSFWVKLQNIVAALLVCMLVLAVMSQFGLFDKTSFLLPIVGDYVGEGSAQFLNGMSHWVVMFVCAFIAYWFFASVKKRNQFSMAFLVFFMIVIGLMDLYNHRNEQKNFTEVYADKVITADKKGNNFVYIAMPNLPSYRYLERISPKFPAAKNTLNAMLGLYTRSGFMLYTNAYTTGNSKFENLAQSLNMSIDGDLLQNHTNRKNMWDFNQISRPKFELSQNKLSETFEKNGYIRKVFEDGNIELCLKNGEQTANYCMRRNLMPYIPKSLDNRSRGMMLLGQWLGSMDIFSSSPKLYALLKSMGVDAVPFVGIDYSDIAVLRGMDILDMVAEDIAGGKGNRAYFVWLAMPDEGYIYDEFCQIKPLEQWVVNGGKNVTEEKRINAYFEQTSCVFGKIADFMRKIKEDGADDKTVVFLQGVSGLDMLSLKAVDRFEAEHMVTMAIKDPKHNKFTINKQFCSAPKIIRQYLFKKDKCEEQEGLNFDNTLKQEILERIENHNVITQSSIKTLNESGEWFRGWMRANYKDMVIPIEMPKVEKVEEVPVLKSSIELKDEKQEVQKSTEVKEIKLHTSIANPKETQKEVPNRSTEEKPELKKISEDMILEKNATNNVVKTTDDIIVKKNSEPEKVKHVDTTEEFKSEKSVKETVSKVVDNISKKVKEAVNNEAEKIEVDAIVVDDSIHTDAFELQPGEEVVVLPQGENKADKIIIRINETQEEKLAKIEEEAQKKAEKAAEEAKAQAEKKAAEAKAAIEKETAEATIKAVETIEHALEQGSVDELGFEIEKVEQHLEKQKEIIKDTIQEKVTEVNVTAPFPIEEK